MQLPPEPLPLFFGLRTNAVAMLKFIIIFCIVAYLFYKIGSFFFRIGAVSQNLRNFQQQQRKGFQDKTSASGPRKGNGSKINGGEYVDYEEVK